MKLKSTLAGVSFSIAALIGAGSANAADPYPTKPVKIIFGFPAASATDVIARACKETAPEELRDQVLATLRAAQATH